MSLEKPLSRGKRQSVCIEEERAWVGFYKRVGSDPAIAMEILTQLESDPQLKRMHLALYLCCKQSLRLHEARRQRHQRIGEFVRRLCHAGVVTPALALRQWLHSGRDIAVECLPQAQQEPAVPQVCRLMREAEFASMQPAFAEQAATEAPAKAAPGNASLRSRTG